MYILFKLYTYLYVYYMYTLYVYGLRINPIFKKGLRRTYDLQNESQIIDKKFNDMYK